MGVDHRFPRGVEIRFLAAYLALFMPFAVATPYLQALLRARGFEHDQIGMILGCFEAMAVLAPPIWGAISDRVGRPRLVLMVAILGCIPTFLAFGLVGSLLGAIFSAVVFGCFYRPLIPLTDGLTFKFINSHGGDYGRIRIGGSISFVLSVVVLERIGIADTTSGMLIIAAMATALVIQLSSVFLLPASRSARRAGAPSGVPDGEMVSVSPSMLRALMSRSFVGFTFCAFLGRVAMMSYYGFFTLYLKERHGFQHVGYLWLLGPLSEMPVMFYSRQIMGKIGVRNFFALGLLGCALRLYGFSLVSAVWMIIPLQLLHSLTFGAFHTASVTYVSRTVPPRLQSSAQTLFAAVTMGAGGILGGVIGGQVARRLGFTYLYGIFGSIALVALLLLMVAVPKADAVEGGQEASS